MEKEAVAHSYDYTVGNAGNYFLGHTVKIIDLRYDEKYLMRIFYN